jgi:DNA modification methylase
MSEKVYSKILPFNDNIPVKSQFGFLPLSIWKPEKSEKFKWEDVAYLDDGIKETRRSEDAEYLPGLGFSEFHAGLAENIVRYWSLPGSTIVDPFSGRATRAVVSARLGRKYYGYEISPATGERVLEHFEKHSIKNAAIYLEDGIYMKRTLDGFADLVMTCPPYYNLEKYESVPGQLSDCKTYDDFMKSISILGLNIHRVLKPGAFCVLVVGDWRDGKQFRAFHADVIQQFTHTLKLHDIIVMENMSPFAAFQAGKCAAKRYTSKIHEYILVFRKEGEYDYSWYKEDETGGKFF